MDNIQNNLGSKTSFSKLAFNNEIVNNINVINNTDNRAIKSLNEIEESIQEDVHIKLFEKFYILGFDKQDMKEFDEN